MSWNACIQTQKHYPRIRQCNWQNAALTLVMLIATVSCSGSWAMAETWANRLGYPSDRKILILHVQDLGMCYETNAAGAALLEGGVVRSASAMAPCPWFPEAAKWSAEHPNIDIGLALTINSERPNYRWRPIARDSDVESLLDPDRFLWPSPIQVMVNARAEDVERELHAQIAFARSHGLKPSHFTTHLGALVARPDLIDAYMRIAREQWVPAMMVEVTPELLARFERSGFPLPENLMRLLADYPLPKVDDLRFVPHGDTYENKKQAFLQMLEQIPPGITQIAINPAVESDALKQIAADWQQRVWEAQLMQDPEVLAALQGDDVLITDWREIMTRFEGSDQSSDQPSSTPTANVNAPQ